MARTSRRGPWLPEEDSALIELVRTQGPNNWVRISQQLQHRSPKQCRERYHQNLKPSLNHDPISAQEGERIEQLVDEMGKRWAEIARRLGNRSDNAVKNWWNGSINRRKRSPSSQSSTRHSGNRLHPVPSNTSHLPSFEIGEHSTPMAGPMTHPHFRDPWSTTPSAPDSDQWSGRMNKLPAMTIQLGGSSGGRGSEQPRQVDLFSYEIRRDHDDNRSRLPPLRLPPITRGGIETGFTIGTGIDKPSVSPALSDFSHTYSTRAVPSLVSDNQSTCSTSPRTLTSPKASATHYTDSRNHRWTSHERPPSYGYQGIKGQLALSPLQIETLVMPPISTRLESATARHEPVLHHHSQDSGMRTSYEQGSERKLEPLRDSRMHVSSLVQ